MDPKNLSIIANNLNPLESEGFILCDKNFNRIKIKCREYIRLSQHKGSLTSIGSDVSMIEIIQSNNASEIINAFPEWREKYEDIKNRYDKLCDEILTTYSEKKDIVEQKDFALSIANIWYKGILFALRKRDSRNQELNLDSLLNRMDPGLIMSKI